MRCRKHLFDDTSAVGVCATCLTERLSAVIEAQALAEAAQLARSTQPDHHHDHRREDRRRSDADAQPPPPSFPCSLDPYISHRKSDYFRPNPNPNRNRQRRHHTMSDQLFYFTPQVGPTAAAVVEEGDTCAQEQRSNFSHFNFCLLSRLFRFRSRSSNRDSSSNRPSWFSNASFSAGRQKDEPNRASVDGGGWKPSRLRRRCADRGMSPARVSDCGGDEGEEVEEWGRGSDCSPEEWKRTPQRPTATPARRFGGHSRNVSRLSFCLSPLVRASPGRQWNQKGMMIMPPPEVSFHGGEVRVPAVGPPRLSTGGLNRSRKLADFGRCNYGHR